MTDLNDIRQFVRKKLKAANDAANQMSLKEGVVRYHREGYRLSLVADIPRFSVLGNGFGAKTWAVVLFVDLRNSSRRADLHGARATYLTMHAYLPAMALLVEKMQGHLVGYRGDGLFAAFGLDENGRNPPGMNHGEEVRQAVRCAKGMLEAVDDAVTPALAEYRVPGDLRIGVGIDAGEIVVTRIGLARAYEVTAYGTAVNKAAHGSNIGNGEVFITPRARKLYPKGPNGTMGFKPHSRTRDYLKVVFPSTFRVLRRQTAPVKK
jgi:class 3 adenylate cyclase